MNCYEKHITKMMMKLHLPEIRYSFSLSLSRVRVIPVLADETILIARLNSNDAIWERRRTECGEGNIFVMNASESNS